MLHVHTDKNQMTTVVRQSMALPVQTVAENRRTDKNIHLMPESSQKTFTNQLNEF